MIAYRSDDMQIIVKTLTGDRKAVALFNRTNSPMTGTLTAGHLKLATNRPIALTDLWDRAGSLSFSKEVEVKLAPHATRLFIATGERQLADGFYISELPGIVNIAVDGVRRPELDPTIYRGISTWEGSRSDGERPVYTGWGGAQPDSAPYGTALTVAGGSFATGIGILSGSRMEVKNDGRFTSFSADVGVDDWTRNRTTPVSFEVYGDGRLLERTKPLSFGAGPEPLVAGLAGVKVVELVARQADIASDPVAVTRGMAALHNARR